MAYRSFDEYCNECGPDEMELDRCELVRYMTEYDEEMVRIYVCRKCGYEHTVREEDRD